MSDVKLVQSNDDGDIFIEAGVVELDSGLESSAYLSLFGGDENDDGSQDSQFEWWGNSLEVNPSFLLRSKVQNVLRSIPSIPANLRRVENAAQQDLQWFIDEKVASSVDVFASFDGPGRVRVTIEIKAEGDEKRFEFTENWRASI